MNTTKELNLERSNGAVIQLPLPNKCMKYTKLVAGAAAIGVGACFYTLPALALGGALATSLAIKTVLQDAILPATDHAAARNYYKDQGNYSNLSLKTSDGVTLRGYHLTDAYDKTPVADKRIIVLFNGNYNPASPNELSRWKYTNSQFLNSDVISLNYRGTFNSEGNFSNHNRYVEDGKELVRALLDKGYRLENMTLLGYSFGGCLAPKIFSHFNKDITNDTDGAKLVLYHTFHRLDKGASHLLPKSCIAPTVRILTKAALKGIGWDYNLTRKEWDNLKGAKIAIGGGDLDKNIPPALSAASFLLEQGASDVVIDPAFHQILKLPEELLPQPKLGIDLDDEAPSSATGAAAALAAKLGTSLLRRHRATN